MIEITFRPPNAILFVAIGVVVVGLISVFLKRGKLARKLTVLVIVIAVAGGIVLVLYRSTTLTVGGEGLQMNGLSGIDLSWDDVEHAYLETNLGFSEYRPTVRTRGIAIGEYRSGQFLLSNGDSARVLMERSDQAVVIVTEELTYLFAPSEIEVLAEAINEFRQLP